MCHLCKILLLSKIALIEGCVQLKPKCTSFFFYLPSKNLKPKTQKTFDQGWHGRVIEQSIMLRVMCHSCKILLL